MSALIAWGAPIAVVVGIVGVAAGGISWGPPMIAGAIIATLVFQPYKSRR